MNVGCSSVGASTSLVNGEKPLVNTLVYKVCVQFPLELHTVAPTNPVMTLTLTLTKGQGADMAMLDNSASAIVRSPEEVAAIARSSTPRRPGQVAPLPMTLTLTLTQTLTLTLEP